MDTLNIGGLVAYQARYRPQARALCFAGQWYNWQQVNERSNRLAQALRAAGVGHGARVVTVLSNCLEMIDIYWACARMGAVAVPLSPLLMASGLRTLLGDAQPAALFYSDTTAAATLPASDGLACMRIRTGAEYEAFAATGSSEPLNASIAPDDLYNIMYTSGTTGLPKGIAL
ncbi:MAG: AMP-binding protein, partial [Pseudomonadota bacterium]